MTDAKHQPLSRRLLSQRAQALVQSLEAVPIHLPDFKDRVVLSRQELLGQPQAIQQTLSLEQERIKWIAGETVKRGIERITMTGCGDSYYCAMAVRYAFERIVRIPVVVVEALEYARYYHLPTNSKTLLIALSASGVGPRTVEALLKAKELGAMTVALSNNLNTPLMDEADYRIQVRARRMGGCPTQSSTGAMAALELLAVELGKSLNTLEPGQLELLSDELHALPSLVEGLIRQHDQATKSLVDRLKDRSIYFFVGSGPGLATANFGAAKVKEMSRDHCVVVQLEEYHHYRSVKPGEPLFLVAPDGLGADRARQAAQNAKDAQGFLVCLVGSDNHALASMADETFSFPPVREEFSVIPCLIPLQLFAVHLGAVKPPAGA
jgi:glucosamine--fructose-6-phosphate aminotransferase (isomerizing)